MRTDRVKNDDLMFILNQQLGECYKTLDGYLYDYRKKKIEHHNYNDWFQTMTLILAEKYNLSTPRAVSLMGRIDQKYGYGIKDL